MFLDWFEAIGGIILVDLVLSGDNALVIGAAASKLSRRQRLFAIGMGGGGAVVLRILFAVLATFLLKLPLLQAIGAAILLFIAVRLLMERGEKAHNEIGEQAAAGMLVGKKKAHAGIWGALLTILLADVTMSLDNVLAVGALADGEWLFLVIGLLLSITILLVGSALVSEVIGRFPWLMDLASLVLAWTAANMVLEDQRVASWLEQIPYIQVIVPVIAIAIVVIFDLSFWVRARRARRMVVTQKGHEE
jgi:YjbE family integral membrane protein